MHKFYDVLPNKDVPSAREDNIITHLGVQKFPKIPFSGREQAFSGETGAILKSSYYPNYCPDCNQTLYSG